MKNLKKLMALMLIVVSGMTLFTGCTDEDDPTPEKSTEKKVMMFRFDQLTPAITATIDHNLKTIAAVMPAGSNLSALTPYIEVSDKASVSPASGSSVDFTAPVNFTVTAEDGSTAVYVASITLDAAGPEVLGNLMNANRTLPDRNPGIDYIVDGMLYLDGNALLTLEPGVTIAFTNVNAGIVVGENAGLKMLGSAAKPIVLTGPVNNNNKGAWYGIIYNSARADNLMDYVQLINGGTVSSEAAIYLNGNSMLRMSHSSITGSAANGIVMYEGTVPVFTNNSISGCEEYPIWCGSAKNLANIGSSNALTNNNKPVIYVRYSNAVEENLTISNPGVPIRFNEDLYVYKDFNLQAGVALEFEYGKLLIIREAGLINAIGDAQNQVIFRGAVDEAGYWGGISIENNRNNRMEHCIVSGGGYDTYAMRANLAVWNDSKLTLSNVKLMKSAGYGFQFSGNMNLIHSNVSFDQCALGNVYDYDNDLIYTTLP
jgi:hypothetical protein